LTEAASEGKMTRNDLFDTLDGKFIARLREIYLKTRTTADGKATITFRTARIEAVYTPAIVRQIEAGRLIAIPNVMSIGVNSIYSIYEVADVYPMHYSMLTLDKSQPGAIRNEFMTLIENEWQTNSKSTWIEIVAAPTGYIVVLNNEDSGLKFIRKSTSPLIGSRVYMLNKETIQKFICYTPKGEELLENYDIGYLLGVTEEQVPFTLNIEKLLHYHVGVFAFTGSGKSNLTSLVLRKSVNSLPNMKFVIFDISSEYGINILDLLKSIPSRIIFTDELRGKDNAEKAKDFLRRHVIPETLEDVNDVLLVSIEETIRQNKIKKVFIQSESEQGLQGITSYGGLLGTLGDLSGEKYGAAAQKILIPTVAGMIRKFMVDNNIEEESTAIGKEIMPLIESVERLLASAKLRQDAALISIFNNLKLVLDNPAQRDFGDYNSTRLVGEIMDDSKDSPRIFVINLPEADTARTFCAEIINRVFRYRKNSFTLQPKIVFVFDEAQEFIPYDKKREDGTEYSSRAVEKLLRHGRKYNLHGWISTQRIAHLNTNALQQLHSYFVSTMPRPYDRQLISDTFAIDDAFMDRTLTFQNGDWLMASFKATNTQNVPVFFHAINNEGYIVSKDQ
jgi:DNA helicase HerA-like ATPase